MRALIKLYWSICRLDAGPEDVPHSWVLLTTVILMNILIGWVQFSFKHESSLALTQSALVIVITVLFTYGVLYIKQFQERGVQTLSALLGTSAVVNLLISPLLVIQPYLVAAKPPFTPTMTGFHFLFLSAIIMVNVWLIMIMVHIYSRALNITYLLALLITIALLGLDILVFTGLF